MTSALPDRPTEQALPIVIADDGFDDQLWFREHGARRCRTRPGWVIRIRRLDDNEIVFLRVPLLAGMPLARSEGEAEALWSHRVADAQRGQARQVGQAGTPSCGRVRTWRSTAPRRRWCNRNSRRGNAD